MRSYPTKKKRTYLKCHDSWRGRGEPCCVLGPLCTPLPGEEELGRLCGVLPPSWMPLHNPGAFGRSLQKQLFNPMYCCSTRRCTPHLGCPGVCRCVSSCAKPAVLGGWRQHLWDGGRKSAATASWMDKCHWVHLPCTRKRCSAMHLSSIYNITIIIFKWAFLYAGSID